eukprot:s1878_g27.t1
MAQIPQAHDWRFAHVYRTQRRVYHGHLPWDHAGLFQQQVSRLTGVQEHDIVYCHHVAHAPADLKAAHTEPLLMHTVADLPIGSVNRLVLVDIEFHEHWPATDVSTSRRCLALPHQTLRRSLLHLLGLDVYCDRVRSRCLMWVNHHPVLLRQTGHFFLEHGDYVRVAVPPWPHAAPSTSTRTCVSHIRRSGRLLRTRTSVIDAQHETGMSEIDDYEAQMYPQRRLQSDDDFDTHSHLQLSLRSGTIPLPVMPSNLLVSEVVAHCVKSHVCQAEPVDKIEDEPQERVQEARQQAMRADRAAQALAAFPPFVQDLHRLYVEMQQMPATQHPRRFFVDTWYSDHVRRPHSGVGRLVHLGEDPTLWLQAIIFAWEDQVGPFHTLTCHLVHPEPEGGDPDALAHIVLVQHAQPDQFSTLVSISDPAEDPWHPRLMCFVIPAHHPFDALQALVDVDHVCARDSPRRWCRAWIGDHEITREHWAHIDHGTAIFFAFLSQAPEADSNTVPIADAFVLDDETSADAVHLLQRQGVLRRRLQLASHLAEPASPVIVQVDCQKVSFLRTQLWDWPSMLPEQQTSDVEWHPATLHALGDLHPWRDEIPMGFTFYTDGTADRARSQAAGAAVLLVTTADGLRWGGYVTAPCLGAPSAPRAEATALLLAIRWLQTLRRAHGAHVWFEFAYDCLSVAGVAQGQLGSGANQDLLTVIRALLHWLEPLCLHPMTWTHMRSHQSHPWNEAADTLCRHALRMHFTVPDLPHFHGQCTFDGNDVQPIQWLWLFEQSLAAVPDAPLLEGTNWCMNIALPLCAQPDLTLQPAMQRQDAQPHGPRDFTTVKLQFGTANVLTLFPGQDHGAAFFSARAEGLAQQFADQNLHFIGLQETRSRLDGHARLNDFHVLSSAATQRGAGGVQLWVRRRIALDDDPLLVDASHLRILHASAQGLLVRFQCGGLRLLVLVLHAPVTDDEHMLSAFWAATSQVIPSKYRSWTLFVLADANSRLGSVTSEAVDEFQADTENIKGEYFHRWMLDHSLYAPQTFQSCHVGQGHTWTHATGATARIDFIAVPQELPCSQISTWIAEDIDLSIQREDHACVCAQVALPFHRVRPDKSRYLCRWLPATAPTWCTDVHTHAATIQQWLRQQQQPRRLVRKQHLTDATVQLIFAKRYHRRRLAALRRHRRLALLRQLFDSWRAADVCSDQFGPWLRLCDRQEAWHLYVFQDLAPRVVQAVRQDDRDFYDELAATAGRASLSGARQLWSPLKPILPRWRSKLRANLRCIGPTIAEKIDHYNRLEAGTTTTYSLLLEQCCQHQRQAMQDAPLQIPLSVLPSRIVVEKHFAQLKVDKASGLDEVRPATVKDHASDISAAVTKLLVKMWTTGAEPAQFKGGLLHTIGKKKRSHHLRDMRGIALLDVMAKLSHAVLRAQFMPALVQARAPLQLGGFSHQTTIFATHYLKAVTHLAHQKGLSSSILFLDIRSAFHALLRELVFDLDQPLPDKLLEVLRDQSADLSGIDAHRLWSGFSDLPHATARLLADAHQHTWYTLAASDSFHSTTRGSRPGSPLADAAYNGLMTRLIRDLQQVLQHDQRLQMAHLRLGLTTPMVAWIDDIAIPILTEAASDLAPVTAWALEQAAEVCSAYGLKLNFQPTKSEAVLTFRGEGASECRKYWCTECQGCVPCPTIPDHLRCVSTYEHLGVIFQADGGISAELQHRVSRAVQAHHQVRKQILHNKHVSCQTRLKLFEGLIVPVLFYGAGAWPLLNHRQLQKIHGVVLRWTRSIIGNGFWASDMLSDQQLLFAWKLPSVALRLAKMRLLYAFHLIRVGPQIILDVITATHQHPGSWFHALRQAMTWLRTMDSTLFSWHPLEASVEEVIQWIHDFSATGPRLCTCPSRAISLGLESLFRWHCSAVGFFAKPFFSSRGPSYSAPVIDDQFDGPLFHRQPAVPVAHVPSQPEVLFVSREQAEQELQRCWRAEGLPAVLDVHFTQTLFAALDLVLLECSGNLDLHADSILLELPSIAEGSDLPVPHGVTGEWALCVWYLDQLSYSRFPHLPVPIFQHIEKAVREFVYASAVGRLLLWQ